MAASYPGSLLSWTQRVNSQTIFAADPNTLAAEIDAIEQFVGLNPQNESSALTGATASFNTLSQRVSAAMLQSGHPYIEISNSTNFNIWHSTTTGHTGAVGFLTTNSNWPGYVGSSGNVTIRDSGIWLINAHLQWQYASTGWVQHVLYKGSTELRRAFFSYDQFPASGSNTFGERYLNGNGHTETTFLGRLSAGTVVSVAAGNYTNVNPLAIVSGSMSLYFVRP